MFDTTDWLQRVHKMADAVCLTHRSLNFNIEHCTVRVMVNTKSKSLASNCELYLLKVVYC